MNALLDICKGVNNLRLIKDIDFPNNKMPAIA